jgi:microcystin-dependent protein
MSEPFLGEIRMFAGTFAPVGWSLCDGTLVPIVNNDALFQLLGTAYGGDGVTNFALPDLRGRLPVHQGTGQSTYTLGQNGGVENATVVTSQLPGHSHTLQATSSGQVQSPAGAFPALATSTQSDLQIYGPTGTAPTTFNPAIVQNDGGGGLPHDNFQPYLCVNFIIALAGIYPSQ